MKRTPLYEIHKQLGARIVDFAGWEMPVQYQGVMVEHRAVRKEAGLFDVSHMGEIDVRGSQAEDFLQQLTCNDVSQLKPGRCQYSGLLTEKGTFIDDIIINRLDQDHFLICVNASNADKDFQWIQDHVPSSFQGNELILSNKSIDFAQIALQGPAAEEILKINFPVPAKKNDLLLLQFENTPLIITRTGYTGEDGFELYAAPQKAATLWTLFQQQGALPCGLGARDTLRLEASYPLYGHEIDDTTTPFEAGLDWIVRMNKKSFVGQETLKHAVPAKKLVGLKMLEPGIPRAGCKIFSGNHEIGWITSGSYSPTLEMPIALGYIKIPFCEKETKIEIDIHNKKRHAEIASTPFYLRKKVSDPK